VAYDASYDWPYAGPKRWRRWVARLFALLALAACGFGVWTIVKEATKADPPAPATLQTEIAQVSASAEALAVRLEALRPGELVTKALAAVREARADQQAAVAELRRRRASGTVRADAALGAALEAHGEYLNLVARVLRFPRTRMATELGARARGARSALAALPDPAGAPEAIRGWKRLAVYARAARG